MDRKKIREAAQDPRLIPGIYNYCDRWCERCPFTSRCLNYAMSEEEFADPETRDIHNEAFWKKMSELLQGTIEMLYEMAREAGIDLDELDKEAAIQEEESRREKAENQECSQAANAYITKVNDWLNAADPLMKEKETELLDKARLNLPNCDPLGEAKEIKEMAEIVRWYQHQIYVKLMRALQGREDEKDDPDLWEEFPKDSDGSAKVALIGIDRSIAAWGKLRGHFPERESEVLDILIHLDRLRKNVEKEFPEARSFIRPGFDEIEPGKGK